MRRVFIRLQGGVGNQLFQYAAGVAVAGVRNVRVLSRAPKPQLSLDELAPGVLRNASRVDLLAIGQVDGYTQRHIQRVLRRGLRGRRLRAEGLVCSQGDLDHESMSVRTYTRRPIIMQGYFQDPSWYEPADDTVVRQLLEHAPPEWEAALRLEYAVISFRRGDYMPLGWCVEMDYYHRSLEHLDRNLPLVVVGDDRSFALSFANNLAQRGWKVIEPPVLHENPSINDFWVIAAARDVVMSNSSFCWWATRVGESRWPATASRTVTFPSHWIDGAGQRLRMRRWIQVDSSGMHGDARVVGEFEASPDHRA